MAAALTYRTIFSLIPTVVLMLLVFRSFSNLDQARNEWQDKLYEYMGLTSITLAAQPHEDPGIDDPILDDEAVTEDISEKPLLATTQPADGEDAQGGEDQVQARRVLQESIDKIIADLADKAANVNFGSIGMVGLGILIWAALSLVITVEQTFNHIYQSPSGRAWHLRIPLYWAVITLGPVLLFLSFNVAGTLVQWAGGLSAWSPWSKTVDILSGFTALGATWLLIFLLYILMPNTKVRLRPALIGAFVAAALWELSKWGFKLYVTKAVSYSALYGSLGLLPLFLLWLYLTWLIVLFGLEITSTLQAMHGREFEKEEARSDPRRNLNPYWLIPLMAEVAKEFDAGRVVDAEALASRIKVPIRSVVALGGVLEEAGLLHQTRSSDDDDGGYALAKPPQNILISKLIDLGRSLTQRSLDCQQGPAAAVIEKLLQAQREAAGRSTLADLVGTDQPMPHEGVVLDQRVHATP